MTDAHVTHGRLDLAPQPMPDVSWQLLALFQLAVTAFLAGLIWVIQLVHYPLFDAVDRTQFQDFERRHSARISWLVAIAMPLEGLLAVWLLLLAGESGPPRVPTILGALLVLFLWLCTALLQVPCHRRLATGYDAAAHRRLLRTNWLRTAAWSLRTALALLIAGAALAA